MVEVTPLANHLRFVGAHHPSKAICVFMTELKRGREFLESNINDKFRVARIFGHLIIMTDPARQFPPPTGFRDTCNLCTKDSNFKI